MTERPRAPGASGTLYLVGTPIGHRDDLSPRARAVLARVPVVACEDTRTARRLFHWLDLPAPAMVAYHDHNAVAAARTVMARLLAGDDVALVSEAGMPALQDPGFRLIVAARAAGVPVVPVPGPSAFALALAASGLPTDRFAFLGFAPRRGRAGWWADALARPETVVVYEAPGRVAVTLESIAAHDPARPVCLARELTKIHEEFVTGSVEAVAAELAGRGEPLKGECALVVGGAPAPAAGRSVAWPGALAKLRELPAGRALSPRALADVLACAYPTERRAIYRAALAEEE
ncbi:MAG: 16S rRNA (cytidine(1402)-2'-O)-methyltransferase [Gemmatimonadota bacterium]